MTTVERGRELAYNEHRATFRDQPIEYIVTLALCLLVIGIPFLTWWHFSVRFQRMWIEGGNIIYERGILSKDRVELQIKTIRSVRLAQTFGQRIFGTGTVFVTSSGSSPEIVAYGMPKARALREMLVRHPLPI